MTGIQPIAFLDAVTGYARSSSDTSADKPIRLAVIDPAYNPYAAPYPDGFPAAKVTFEGEGVLSGKAYAVASGVVPSPGARVWLVPIGTTYLIAGGAGGAAAILPVAYGGTGKTSVTAGNYLKGNGTGALVEVTPATVRSEIGANDASNLTAGDLPVARLDTRIVSGSVSITPSAANTPTTVTWTYGRTLSGTVRALVTPNTSVPGTTVTGCSVTTPTSTSVAVYLTRTNTSLTIVYCLAMGGWG